MNQLRMVAASRVSLHVSKFSYVSTTSKRACTTTTSAAEASATLNTNKILDKDYRHESFNEITTQSPVVLLGLGEKKGDALSKLNLWAIEDMGNWKYYLNAVAIQSVAEFEEAGARPAESVQNIDGVLDKGYRQQSLQQVLKAPPSAFLGLTPKHDDLLSDMGIKSIGDLAANKFFKIANAYVKLAAMEKLE